MKKLVSLIVVVLLVCMVSGCISYVNTEGAGEGNASDVKEDKVLKDVEKEEPIKPVVVQKLSADEAKEKAEKTYGGKEMVIRLNGEYTVDDVTYYVFDIGADMGGFFSKDFSVVVDAQSGEMFEGSYDKVNKKIIRY